MGEIKSPIKAIRQNCINCSGGDLGEVRNCMITDCPLYAFRFGKNPYVGRKMTDEQREAAIERLRKSMFTSKTP